MCPGLHILTHWVNLDHPQSTDRPLVGYVFIPVKYLAQYLKLAEHAALLQVPPLDNEPLSLWEGQSVLLLSTFHPLIWDSSFKCYPETRVGFLKNMNSYKLFYMPYKRCCFKQFCYHWSLPVLPGTSKQFSVKIPVQQMLILLTSLYIPHPTPPPPHPNTPTSYLHRYLQVRWIKRKRENNLCVFPLTENDPNLKLFGYFTTSCIFRREWLLIPPSFLLSFLYFFSSSTSIYRISSKFKTLCLMLLVGETFLSLCSHPQEKF